MNSRMICLVGSLLVLGFLAGCSTSSLGELPGNGPATGPITRDEISGTVDQVNALGQFIVLRDVDSRATSLVNRDSSMQIYFDEATPVAYQGNTYRPADLERGDRVAVRVDRSGNRLMATSMTVLSDVSAGGTGMSGMSLSNVQGTVRDIDPLRKTIEVIPTSGISGMTSGMQSPLVIQYDANTVVGHQDRLNSQTPLERGDVVDVQVQRYGSNYLAQRITVVRSAQLSR